MKILCLFRILGFLFFNSCASTDATTIMFLNQRLKALENAQTNNVTIKDTSVPKDDSIVYWVNNSNDSVSAIKITRKFGKFIGPKNEEYLSLPT